MKAIDKFQVMAGTVLLIILNGCTSSDNFSGGGSNGGTVKKPESKPPQTQNPLPSVPSPEQCTHSKLTGIRSLRSVVDQRGADRRLPIELTFQPCVNQKNGLQLPVKFDLDADIYFPNQNASIPYELNIGGSKVSSGVLASVRGSDLFDKKGEQYIHFMSSSPLLVSPSLETATLILDLQNLRLMGPSNSGSPAVGNFSVDSHIRVGDPPPVTGQMMFTPAPSAG